MRSVQLKQGGVRTSALGFGCSAVMGRVGRKDSLAALSAAYDAGITFYDTARSYGYGESEALLGEFLRGRRDSVVLSTKFGILPAESGPIKRAVKPLARRLIKAAPVLRQAMRQTVAAQFSPGHFTVKAMQTSLEASLRKLGTGFVDLLFLHLPPVSVFQQQDLLGALEQLMVEGKVLRVGVAAETPVAMMALDANLPILRTIQAPCNLFDLTLANAISSHPEDVVAIANHPFGGPQGVAASRARLTQIASALDLPVSLRPKLKSIDDATLADLTLNLITVGTGIKVVVPSMLSLDHLRTNIAAMEHSRLTVEELVWLRMKLSAIPQSAS